MAVVSAQNSLNQLIYNYDMLVFTFENPMHSGQSLHRRSKIEIKFKEVLNRTVRGFFFCIDFLFLHKLGKMVGR